MPFLNRLLPAVAVMLCCVQAAQAQSLKLTMPSEGELNRQGLQLSWWAQSGVNPVRDRAQFLTADEQNVFVQSSTGIISSFHAELGRKLWSQLVGRPDQQSYPATTSDREVLITVGLHMFALDKDSGRRAWELQIPEYPSTSPSMDEKYIFAGTVDGSVLAYDHQKIRSLFERGMLPQWTVRGRLWNFQTPDEVVSPPIPMGERVLFASRKGVVYSLTSSHKDLKFQMETGAFIQTPLGYNQDRVFVADRNARMLCLNAETGRTVWTFAGGTPINQQPRAVGAAVYIVPHREGLTSLSVASGAIKWQQKIATSFVAASDNRVYARDIDGNLLILDKETGNISGMLNLRNFPMHVSNDRTDRLFLCSTTGTVIALRELGSDYPNYHLHPERRPILPELAPEEQAEAESTN